MPLGIVFIAAAQVLNLFRSLFQDSQESGPGVLHPGSTHTSFKLGAEAIGATRQGHDCRFRSSWFLCIRYKPSEDLYCFILVTSPKNTGFPGGSVGKNPPASARRLRRHGFNPWVGKSPWRRVCQPTSVFSPGKSHGQRSLVGNHPWSCQRVRQSMHTKEHAEGDTYKPKSTYLSVYLSTFLCVHFEKVKVLVTQSCLTLCYILQLSKLRPKRYLPSPCCRSCSARF